MTLDVEALRADTAGCADVVHFNHAGSSLQPRPVVETVVDYVRLEAELGGYEAAAVHQDYLEGVYATIARLIGAVSTDIALFQSATLAWDTAFYGMRLGEGDRILTTTTEYASNYIAYLHQQRQTGVEIDVVPDTPDGEIDLAALADLIDDDVKLISINHMPTQQGLINPAAEVGAVARAAGVPFLLDACQTVGQLPIDVAEIGCDFLSATSRKYLRGPRGIGFLYVRPGLLDRLEPPVLDLRGAVWTAPGKFEVREDARRLETWEMSQAARAGFHRAVEYALDVGVAAAWDRLHGLAEMLRTMLTEVPGVTVTDRGRVRGGLVTFTVDGTTASAIRSDLRPRKIHVSTSTRSSALLDMSQRGLDEVVRASVHYYNTEDELDTLVGHISRLARAAQRG